VRDFVSDALKNASSALLKLNLQMTYAGFTERVIIGPDFTRGEQLECVLEGFGAASRGPGSSVFRTF
jgi:hypothetical protein